MLGIGVYIDDVEGQVARIKESIDDKIDGSAYVILAIGAIAVGAVFVTGLLLPFSKRKLADEK